MWRLLDLPKQELISHSGSDGAEGTISSISVLQTMMGKDCQVKSTCPKVWRKSQPLLWSFQLRLQGRGEDSSPKLQVAPKVLDGRWQFPVLGFRSLRWVLYSFVTTRS